MATDLFSIVIPVYNVELYLDSCISSVLAQTYSHFELILVDDGSTDSSGQICDNYAIRDNRVKVIHQKNGGASCARNAGIEVSQGDWICFVDSDDRVTKDWLEHYAIAADSDMLVQGLKLIWTNGRIENAAIQDARLENELRLDIDFAKYKFNSPCKCFREKVIRDSHIRFAEGMLSGEDLLFVLQFMINSTSIRFIPYHGYIYNREGSSLTRKYNLPSKYLEWNDRIVETSFILCRGCVKSLLCRSILGRQFAGISQFVTLQYDGMTRVERFQFYDVLKKMRPFVEILKMKWTRWGFLAVTLPNAYFDVLVKTYVLLYRILSKYGKNETY